MMYSDLSVSNSITHGNWKNLPLADVSISNDGKACGDKVEIDIIFLKNNIITIGFKVSSCHFTANSTSYLFKKINKQHIINAKRFIEKFIEQAGNWNYLADNPFSQYSNALIIDRMNCILLPWEAVLEVLNSRTSSDIHSYQKSNQFKCDACVVIQAIEWKDSAKPAKTTDSNCIIMKNKKNKLISKIFHSFRIKQSGKFTDDVMFMQKYGKIVLRDEEEKELKQLVLNSSIKNYKYLKSFRCMGVLKYHLTKMKAISINPQLALILTKAKTRFAAQCIEIRNIAELIRQYNIDAIAIKGSFTKKFYYEGSYRYSNDIDYLIQDFRQALLFFHYLVVQDEYVLPYLKEIPFSLKIVLDSNQREVLTGHYHIQKLNGIEEMQKMIVDVNFPGIPLGLLNTTLFPSHKSGLLLEEEIIITLTHLFKHEIAFIKDLNDLYLMLKSWKDKDSFYFWEMIKRYSLNFLIQLVVAFLIVEYKLEKTYFIEQILRKRKLYEKLLIPYILKKKWPYKIGIHAFVQALDILLRMRKKIGIRESLKLIANVSGAGNKSINYTKKYSKDNYYTNLFNTDIYQRFYLLPLIFFKKCYDINNTDLNKLEELDCSFIKDDKNFVLILIFSNFRLLLSMIGIFLIVKDLKLSAERMEIINKVWELIEWLELLDDDLIVVRSSV